jgi:hypothetical protein
VAIRSHGSAAIRVSRQYTEAFVSPSRVARAAFTGVLRAVDHLPPQKRRMFAGTLRAQDEG